MRSQVRFLLAPPSVHSEPEAGKGDPVKFIRQAILAISLGGIIAAVLRTRGKSPDAPSQGGWREVTPQR